MSFSIPDKSTILIDFETFNKFVHQSNIKIIHDLGLSPCEGSLQILHHLNQIQILLDSDN